MVTGHRGKVGAGGGGGGSAGGGRSSARAPAAGPGQANRWACAGCRGGERRRPWAVGKAGGGGWRAERCGGESPPAAGGGGGRRGAGPGQADGVVV